ncbi:CPBP family intramembrane glutamic endopeptidase [Williamsia herbipolensis]|uniref:CPBP family intramembrane glutamic endopeptidase n=1 Tax=Williamsia herbipolensis TaxID=1603258 RepID=UPI0005F78D8D|nr:CPBP family intramembrane glutamic endopeptidase [Williamsia herbipolensis]
MPAPAESNQSPPGTRDTDDATGLGARVKKISLLSGALVLLWAGAFCCGLALKALMQGEGLVVAAALLVIGATLAVVTTICGELDPRTVLVGYGLRPTDALGFRPARIVLYIGLGFVLAAAAWLIATYVTSPLFPRPDGLVDDRATGYSSARPVVGALGQFVQNGFPEELMFRTPVVLWAVMIMPTFATRVARWSSGAAVVLLTSVLFAAIHSEYGMWNMSHAFLSGLLYGTAALLFRSLWPTIIAHTAYDTAVLVL